jgi:hypothetical protein
MVSMNSHQSSALSLAYAMHPGSGVLADGGGISTRDWVLDGLWAIKAKDGEQQWRKTCKENYRFLCTNQV